MYRRGPDTLDRSFPLAPNRACPALRFCVAVRRSSAQNWYPASASSGRNCISKGGNHGCVPRPHPNPLRTLGCEACARRTTRSLDRGGGGPISIPSTPSPDPPTGGRSDTRGAEDINGDNSDTAASILPPLPPPTGVDGAVGTPSSSTSAPPSSSPSPPSPPSSLPSLSSRTSRDRIDASNRPLAPLSSTRISSASAAL